MRKKKNEISSVECACGERCEITGDIMKKMGWSTTPEFLECSECPVCTPELLDSPEDHENEAYEEDIDIEELEQAFNDDSLMNDEDDFDEFDGDYDEYERL